MARHEVHLRRRQQLGVIVQGVDPQVHPQALAQAQIIENQAVTAYASEVQRQAQSSCSGNGRKPGGSSTA